MRRFREHEGNVFFHLMGENSPFLQDVQPEVLPPISNPEEAEFCSWLPRSLAPAGSVSLCDMG
ncbi:MAG: hypothetical protein IPH16_17865 [Haliscomenobacter sp.]|nr:hypothetical protein [Haliscomenobacter sp.]